MFIQSDDADVKKLAVFETPPTNTSVTERCFLNFHPVSGTTPTTNVIHFSVKGLSLKYVDLQCSRLYIRCKIRDMDGGVPDQDIVFPARFFCMFLWLCILLISSHCMVLGNVVRGALGTVQGLTFYRSKDN